MGFSTHAMSGLLVIDKPAGVTSRDCVNAVQRSLIPRFPKPQRIPKVGHAGTLDPLAEGVLIVGIGGGVRLVPYLLQLDKVYDATFHLGVSSESGDIESAMTTDDLAPIPSECQLHEAADALTGEITQVPPMTSAIKIKGRRAYTYAHRGREIAVPPRQVYVHRIDITRYQYPELDLRVRCGSGTYIRTLGMDLAELCGTSAVMFRLVRPSIGHFTRGGGLGLEQLNLESIDRALLPMAAAVAHLPSLIVDDVQLNRLVNGLMLDAERVRLGTERHNYQAVEAKVLDDGGNLRVIARLRFGEWCPYRVFHLNE